MDGRLTERCSLLHAKDEMRRIRCGDVVEQLSNCNYETTLKGAGVYYQRSGRLSGH